jgi:hypothetical protein
VNWDGPEVARLRKVKEEIYREFGSVDKLIDHLQAMDKARMARERKKKAKARSKSS